MAEIKVVCPNCNTPRRMSVESLDGAVKLSCKRCFKRSRILIKDGNAVAAVKPEPKKAPKEEKAE